MPPDKKSPAAHSCIIGRYLVAGQVFGKLTQLILTQCDNNDPIDIDNNAVVAIVSRPQAVLAFAVVGTRLKTNGRSTGKQSGTKGWSGRCKEEKEVGPKKTKKGHFLGATKEIERCQKCCRPRERQR